MTTPAIEPATAATQALLAYASTVLGPACVLAAAHEFPGAPPFADEVGPHLRHVIEHYESWLGAAGTLEVDCDRRARDPELERSPGLTRRRLRIIRQRLAQWPPSHLALPLDVHAGIGVAGESGCTTASSFGRERLFVTSHAVHHFALLQAHCREHGISAGAHFGKAPATVAHERARRGATDPDTHNTPEEKPCPVSPPSA